MSGPNDPPPENKTPSTETPAQAAARMAAAAQEDAGTRTAAQTQALRDFLRSIGVALPANTNDLYDVAERLQKELSSLDVLTTNLANMSPFMRSLFQPVYNDLKRRTQGVADQLFAYAGEMFGAAGEKAISFLLRPAEPNIQKLPTAEEFLGDYQNAFTTHIEGLRSGGQLSNEEANFAMNQLQNEYLQKYTARMGELAKTGVSPFSLGEVSREERGVGAGTEAGAALDKALGPGVKEPTTITGLSADVSKQAQDIGTGVAREFTARAVIKPLDFLTQTLSPTSIKLAYAGSQYGAGKSTRPAPAGWTSGSRRA